MGADLDLRVAAAIVAARESQAGDSDTDAGKTRQVH
jgi:hypothetical protein